MRVVHQPSFLLCSLQHSRSKDYETIQDEEEEEEEGRLDMGEEAEVKHKPAHGKKKATLDDLKEEIQMVCMELYWPLDSIHTFFSHLCLSETFMVFRSKYIIRLCILLSFLRQPFNPLPANDTYIRHELPYAHKNLVY